MKVLSLHNETLRWTLKPGEESEVLLLSPVDVELTIDQQAGSRLQLFVVSLGEESGRVSLTVEQNGEGCRTELYGLALTRGAQQVDVETHVLHNVGGGHSEQLFKNVLMDSSRCSFYGELKVLPDAQKTEAYQTNRNILLSKTARMRTRPQLEIYADDVRCSHGATTGQLSDQALFYMRQRGIAEREARLMLLQAFLADVLTPLPDEQLRDDLAAQLATILTA